MLLVRRLLSPVGFGLVLLTFLLLPVLASRYSDDRSRIALTWQGTDLVVGGDSQLSVQNLTPKADGSGVEVTDVSDDMAQLMPELRIALPVQPVVIVTALLMLGGVLTVALRDERARVRFAAGIAVAATLALGLGHVVAARAVDSTGFAPSPTNTFNIDPFEHGPAVGFWVALALLAALAVGNAAVLFRRQPAPAQAG